MIAVFWAAFSGKFEKIKQENAFLNDEKHPIFKNFDEAKLSTIPGFELHMCRVVFVVRTWGLFPNA